MFMFCNENLTSVVEALNDLIPMEGSVTNPVKNRKLEQYRVAQNVTYDIFNNGLGNKGRSLKALGLKMYDLPLDYYRGGECIQRANWTRIKEIVEPIMEKKIMLAAVEQGIEMELVPNANTGKLELEAA
jgi:hypothetical protein